MANEIRVEKCFYDLNEYMDYSGFLTQAEVPYLVFGVEEEFAALNAVQEASPEKLENLTRQTLEISERINQDIFKVLVTYEMDVFGGSNGDNERRPVQLFEIIKNNFKRYCSVCKDFEFGQLRIFRHTKSRNKD